MINYYTITNNSAYPRASQAYVWDRLTGSHSLGAPIIWGGVSAFNDKLEGAGGIGAYYESGNYVPFRFFRWDSANGVRLLDAQIAPDGYVTAINASGQMVGCAEISYQGLTRPFITDGDNIRFLSSQTGCAQSVNGKGQAVGYVDSYLPYDGYKIPYFWDSDGTPYRLATDGGNLVNGFTLAVNDNGLVAGYFFSEQARRAVLFLWDIKNGLRELTLPPNVRGNIVGLNNSGQIIVNTSLITSGSYTPRAAIIDNAGQFHYLNDFLPPNSNWDLQYALAINDSGEILGIGSNGLFLLSPAREPLIFVPGIAGSLLDVRGGENLWLGSAVPYGFPGYTDRSKLTLDPNKQQYDVIASRVFDKTIFATQPVLIYQSLLDFLTTTGGYVAYDDKQDPYLRTTANCDTSQNNPTLFVFPYDWRKNNIQNAAALKDYIGCVQKYYPKSKVNILTHSMGSLLARRYILDNPGTHNVKKMITIGAPWLGAPKAIYTLETGVFFTNPLEPVSFKKGISKSDHRRLAQMTTL